ncbi:type I restriction-modification system endonuclease [Psychrobacter sp. I-STPA10]|uniref:type I restriction-modification system endonuclease n=1 Tax=Psychrobacter sp. I-STPA10 TaxID=2585769 RepID=UPI001E4F0B33|nr:type I restriction-modification system endonuclease [Psychrobacter sp. I-STPA10]
MSNTTISNSSANPTAPSNHTQQYPSNFDFLAEHDPIFLQLASNAERVFYSDPNTTLIKLRQLGEALAQGLAVRTGVDFDADTKQVDLLNRLQRELNLDRNIIDIFHKLRQQGNVATHQFQTNHGEASKALKMARMLCVWYHQNFGKAGSKFKPEPFKNLPDPSEDLQKLQQQISQLSSQLDATATQVDSHKQIAKLQEKEKLEYQQLAEMMDEEARQLAEQNKQQEQLLLAERERFEAQIASLKAQLAEQPQTASDDATTQIKRRLTVFIPTEEDARLLIDEQLRLAGWEADSQLMTQTAGTLPEVGKNKAIAEWRTANGRADYVLFMGLTPIAVIEAKRENINVAGRIGQAERYAQGLAVTEPMQGAWLLTGQGMPWCEYQQTYYVPFVFSCNGRSYVEQLKEKSGIWFRDVRHGSNTKRALQQFYSPEGLLDVLTRDIAQAEDKLQQEPFGYLNLRDYQVKAIKAVEQRLAQGQRDCLLAMATGTGKTRTIIGLIYRFLKTERFKQILFLVDRTALGNQAFDSMQEMTLEQNQTLSKIYNIAELGDMQVEAETRVQVATVQAMVRRIFDNDDVQDIPTIDQYDCIIIDEAHRGYTLDQEMSEGELLFRDTSQYLSSYRRVLQYFDAVKIGLTATPAKHTVEIFGRPVYVYSYPEAVADDWLIDYEPPIRYTTLLSKNGIHLDKGEQVSVLDSHSGEVDITELEDELNFEVAQFNRSVVTESFNRVICEQLVQEIDPNGNEKTLIFCATDLHADMVKRLLDDAFSAFYGNEYNEVAVRKITGASDKVDQLISRFKNEKYPSIAITVDLLTTGIDVPAICHLVFLRRVKSRILFQQMMGRATRRCDDIGKTVFKVYDPVDIFASLEQVNTMKPLVKNPNITIEQLVQDLLAVNTDTLNELASNDPVLSQVSEPLTAYQVDETENSSGNSDNGSFDNSHEVNYLGQSQQDIIDTHSQVVLDQLSQKLMRVLRKAVKKAERNPELKVKLDELEASWQVPPEKLHQLLHQGGVKKAQEFLQTHANLLTDLAEIKHIAGSDYMPVIYEGEDEFISREQSFGQHQRPEDYLESFEQFIKTQLNESIALTVVATRPAEMTRETLKEVKLLLDEKGYSEAHLQTAWRNKTNKDIAASIVGHIRRAALGEPLIPFAQRVDNAMTQIYQSQDWTPLQRKWLERLAKQLQHETIVDRQFVNQRFAADGGAKWLDKILQEQLDEVLAQVNEQLWQA